MATTRRGRYCLKRAQERITRRKPIARTWFALDGKRYQGEGRGGYEREEISRRTKESEMMVLRPAVILGSERGTLLVVSCGQAAGPCASLLRRAALNSQILMLNKLIRFSILTYEAYLVARLWSDPSFLEVK